MLELDGDGDPRSKAGEDRDPPRGRPHVMRPPAVSHQDVSTLSLDFEALMSDRRTPSHSPPPEPHRRRRRHNHAAARRRLSPSPHPPITPILHSAPHILSDCPLVSIFRDRILKDYSVHYLFWTVKGAAALALFLLRLNSSFAPCLPALICHEVLILCSPFYLPSVSLTFRYLHSWVFIIAL